MSTPSVQESGRSEQLEVEEVGSPHPVPDALQAGEYLVSTPSTHELLGSGQREAEERGVRLHALPLAQVGV